MSPKQSWLTSLSAERLISLSGEITGDAVALVAATTTTMRTEKRKDPTFSSLGTLAHHVHIVSVASLERVTTATENGARDPTVGEIKSGLVFMRLAGKT